jgi:ATP-dependent RNA helicase DDX52/ROK1
VKNVANVIAASEKLKKGEKLPGQGLQQWLLDALPKPTKREKQELKQRGVASRNINGGEGSAKSRISTKSGYERQVENRKKGAVEGAKRRKMAELEEGRSAVEAADTDAFGGFDD